MINSLILAILATLLGSIIGFFSFFGLGYSISEQETAGFWISVIGMVGGFGFGLYGVVSILFQVIAAIKA